jgi:hypothetical protein
MHGVHGGAIATLQDTHAIDHGVDPGKPRPPGLGRDVSVEVPSNPIDTGQAAAPIGDVAAAPDDAVPGRAQPGDNVRPDETVGAGDQDSHAADSIRNRRPSQAPRPTRRIPGPMATTEAC